MATGAISSIVALRGEEGFVVLDLSTLSGVVTFSGGTGEFTHFQAGPIVVACPALPDCSWDGPYSFMSDADDEDD